jgi:hypothetical protein
VEHHAAHDEEKIERIAMLMLKEAVDMEEGAQVSGGAVGRGPKEIEPDAEQDGVENAGYQDPFPDLMFGDEMMSLDIRLKRYDDFFEQPYAFCVFLDDTGSNVRIYDEPTKVSAARQRFL